MNEQFKEVPPLEFSRLGFRRKNTITLNTTPAARLFTYGTVRKKSIHRIPRSISYTNIEEINANNTLCSSANVDNVRGHNVLLTTGNVRKNRINRIPRSTSHTIIKVDAINTKVDDVRGHSFRWNIKRPNINRRQEVQNARNDILNQLEIHGCRASSTPRSRKSSTLRSRASSTPRPCLR